MSWLPGWNTITGTNAWENAFFWGSIIALILLGIMEVASHRAAQRKDELTEQQQTETQRRHDEDMAALHLQASQANERAAKLEIEAAAANERTAEIMKATAWRGFTPSEIASLEASLSAHPGKIVIGWILGDAESLSLATQFANILRRANPQWTFMSDAKAYETALVFGIYIPASPGADDVVNTLRNAFKSADIEFKTQDLPKSTGMGFGDPGSKENLALIFFGSKEPTFTQPPF